MAKTTNRLTDPNSMIFARNVKVLRRKMGISQIQMAKALDTTRSSINNWENGMSSPHDQTKVKLSRFFNVSVDAMLTVELADADPELLGPDGQYFDMIDVMTLERHIVKLIPRINGETPRDGT